MALFHSQTRRHMMTIKTTYFVLSILKSKKDGLRILANSVNLGDMHLICDVLSGYSLFIKVPAYESPSRMKRIKHQDDDMCTHGTLR